MTIQAFRVRGFGQAPALEAMAAPVPGPGEVALLIHACGLNFADLLMAGGSYQDTPPPPFTLGMEVCGTVTARGPGVSTPAIGDRVVVFGGQGGLAQAGCFPAARCRKVPAGMEATVAAGLLVAYGTAHLALTRRARLAAGETLVVLGAAGGVGLAAVETGKALGAHVIAVARGADKLAVATAAGADSVIDSADMPDLKAALKAAGGCDVVFDPVGGNALMAALGACRPEGRVLSIGFAAGEVPAVPANILLVKNLDLIGVYWGGYLRFAPQVLDDSLAEVMEWQAAGRISPHVSHVLPLARAGEALELLRERKSTGKVVVVMEPPA